MRAGAIVVCVLFMVGCASLAPAGPAAVPAPTAAPQCTTSDGKAVPTVLSQYAREWQDALSLAISVPGGQLAAPISQLQRTRRDVEAQTWPACAQNAQRLLVEAMNAHLDGLLALSARSENPTPHIARGNDAFDRFNQAVMFMMGQPTPTLKPSSTPIPVPTTAPTLAPLQSPITHSGKGSSSSPPFILPAGRYVISWEVSKSPQDRACAFLGTLSPTRATLSGTLTTRLSDGHTLMGDDKPVRGTTEPLQITEGEYELAAPGSCQWTITITPAP